MQNSFSFGASDDARKRANKLSDRSCMIIGAAANTMPGTGTISRYKGFVGFQLVGGDFVYIGNGGALRITRAEKIDGGSPRRLHAASSRIANRLIRQGRGLVAQCDVAPNVYKRLVAFKPTYLNRSGLDPVAACDALRTAIDTYLGDQKKD